MKWLWLIPLILGAIPFVLVLLRRRSGNVYRVDLKKHSHLTVRQQSILQTWLNVCLMNGWKPSHVAEWESTYRFTALDPKDGSLIRSFVQPSCADLHGTLVGNIQRDQAN